MKTNDYLLMTATVTYSYLFYQQNAGINILIFVVMYAFLLCLRNRSLLTQSKWLIALVLCLVSSVGVLLNSSALAIAGTCCSLMLLSAASFNSTTSFIFSFLFSVYSMCSAIVWVFIDATGRSSALSNEVKDPSANKNKYRTIAILLVVIFCLVFLALYKQANPLFAENTKWINFDFISLTWLLFTFGSFFIVYPLFYHKTIKPIEVWENNLSLTARASSVGPVHRFEMERVAGVILFIFLNLMLVILNFGDVTSIWFNFSLPKGMKHSDFVHNGVGLIILSIVIATVLIMFLFRKNFNEYKHSKLLKALIYFWIIQNIIMLISTAIRNDLYIQTFNFTYKRIGVYYWLGLAIFGLVIMFTKVFVNKSNWFLVRTNFAVWFTILAFSGLVNWDGYITQYNLKNKPLRDVDLIYLFSLSDTNIPELLAVTKHKDFSQVKEHIYNRSKFYYSEKDYLNLLHEKIFYYMRDYRSDWQSWDLRDKRIIYSLVKSK
ncbi:MAG: hypothetical protein JWO32_1594 [Bacteroidetes bacterium]|nr:hypothetical protein [Bacteroidota bacterium]